MKKQLLNIASIKVYTTALFTALVLSTSFTPANASEKTKNDNEAKITYVGNDKDLITFNISYNNTAEESFLLTLTDDQGQVLFQKKFNDKVFNKNIFVKNQGEDVRVNFTLKTTKNSITQKFDIDSQTKMIEEIIVTKL